ncbi:hypothetical protein [Streptomyces sp. NBC_01264]|uniref:hypothetical protein n=1 Tax=Streptomyces sp. NBC_01264 TaxID=2903804 RepID=UPI00224E7927|nr:hypothetical protein [Streptomyces sp. NBC_01264]MCX4778941.1 hypothetical protein [Streptomyces sp. NBC_01264]
MSEERAQGRGWVRIPASRAEQPGTTRAAPAQPYGPSPYARDSAPQGPYPQDPYAHLQHPRGQHAQAPYAQAPYDPSMIYLSLVKRWQEAGRTLPGHPDEEWERLISQPCWPGR